MNSFYSTDNKVELFFLRVSILYTGGGHIGGKEDDEVSFLSITMPFQAMACSSTIACLLAIIPHCASDFH